MATGTILSDKSLGDFLIILAVVPVKSKVCFSSKSLIWVEKKLFYFLLSKFLFHSYFLLYKLNKQCFYKSEKKTPLFAEHSTNLERTLLEADY